MVNLNEPHAPCDSREKICVAYLSLKVVLQMALDLIAVTGGQAMSIGSQLVEEGLARNLTGN